ncbi:RfeC [Microsporum canis CBS 113480]|uniref:RfeC n=1 Tax=Arthroderma otae (strain ATCC MYA-4605 / CBS 113480) TaxID=554155 RepID=C5FWM0_ARTOC|nr:RfeC [Microsporum canis CBS 113480]EEQ34304.1 RfeC [Microsporum canis CBS 113480]
MAPTHQQLCHSRLQGRGWSVPRDNEGTSLLPISRSIPESDPTCVPSAEIPLHEVMFSNVISRSAPCDEATQPGPGTYPTHRPAGLGWIKVDAATKEVQILRREVELLNQNLLETTVLNNDFKIQNENLRGVNQQTLLRALFRSGPFVQIATASATRRMYGKESNYIWTILETHLVIYKSDGASPDLPKSNAVHQTSDMGPLPPSFTAATAIIVVYFPTLSSPEPESVCLPRLASPFSPDHENKQPSTQASPNKNEHFTTHLVSESSLEQATPIPSNKIMEWLAKDPGLEVELSTITTYFSLSGKSYGDMETIKWQLVQNLVDYPLDGVRSYFLFPPGDISTNDIPNKVEWIIHQNQGLGYSGVWQYDGEKAALLLPRQDNMPHGLFVLLASTVLRCLENSPSVMLSEIQSDGIHILVLAYTEPEPDKDAIQFVCNLACPFVWTSRIEDPSQRSAKLREMLYQDRMPMLDKYMGPFFNGNQGRYLVDL